MTGVYQCYCVTRVSALSFWKVWSDPELEVCGLYAAMGMGGSLLTLPSGILNALMTNIGAYLITKLVPLIRFHSKHKETHVTVISIFVMSYFNMGLLCLHTYGGHFSDHYFSYLPKNLTPNWLNFWGKAITTSLIVSTMLPYVSPLLKFLFQRGFCCCKRKDYKA